MHDSQTPAANSESNEWAQVCWNVFNDDNDVQNGYDRNSLMGMLYCVAKALRETNPSFVPILVYLDRLCINHPSFVISENNIRRLCLVAIWVSNKMFDDMYIANWWYAELLNISKEHFNYLETMFVQLLQFDLNVTVEEYRAYCSHMRDFILETFSKQNQQCEPTAEQQNEQTDNRLCN